MTAERTLVTGGNGRLGQAVLAALGERGIAGVRRRDVMEGALLIGSGGAIAPDCLQGIDVIINCAGRVSGTAAAIEQANVGYATALARVGRAAGVRRFVQVSSFSVFGRTERIEPDSQIAPANPYGRSKAAAEQALIALATPGFEVVVLRLPFMFSAEHPALLGRLVDMLVRVRVLPSPAGAPSRRSMITYAGAAAALVSAADLPSTLAGLLTAADPVPLDLPTIARSIDTRLRKRILIMPVSATLTALVGRIAPATADRLFRSSVLASAANMLKGPAPRPVAAELDAYLDRLAAAGPAGHDRQS